jgi:ribosomal protein S18 acetylase RimI-like enzyme
MDVTLRRAVPSDVPAMKRAVHAAWRWHEPWDEIAYEEHQRTAGADSYVDDFGAHAGDTGVVAMTRAGVCGAAWFRYFTSETARAGYLADTVPELVLAVDERVRGEGLGSCLLDQLLSIAAEQSIPQISLHVDAGNARAITLYESRGFTSVRATPRGKVMVWGGPGSERTVPG